MRTPVRTTLEIWTKHWKIHTLKLYPNLGHSLGKASSVIDDRFRPIDAQPIQDVADWLETQI